MKVGDLVKNIYTDELHIITHIDLENAYYEVDAAYLIPEEHLEVINGSR